MICHGWLRTVGEQREIYGAAVDKTSAAAEEGTRAHTRMAEHLSNLSNFVTSSEEVEPRLVQEGDDEYDDLIPLLEWLMDQEGELYLELNLDFGTSMGWTDLRGTVDIVFVTEDELRILDLKYGRGVVVEITDGGGRPNPQLMIYLLAAIDKFGPRKTYRIGVMQPRAYHPDGPIREFEVPPYLVEVFRFELDEAIKANFSGGPQVAGPHCMKFCPALGTCRAAAARAKQIFKEMVEALDGED